MPRRSCSSLRPDSQPYQNLLRERARWRTLTLVAVTVQTPGPKQKPAQAPRGLGDVVETVAKPIAKALGIKDCAPCQRRKELLNQATARARAGVKRIFGGS